MVGYSHPLIAIAFQSLLGELTGNYWFGVVGSVFFLARELTQAEYRWIETYGLGLRRNMPWWGRFDYRVWDFHSMTDWLLPLIFTTVIALQI